MTGDSAHDVAQALIEAAAPEELPMFDGIVEALEKPASRKNDPLASGVGDGWMWSQLISPTLIAVAIWMTKDVVGKAAGEVVVPRIKALVERLITKKSEPNSITRSLDAEDYQTIAAVVGAIKDSAQKRGLAADTSNQICDAISTKLQATLASVRVV